MTEVFLGIGSNLGNSLQIINNAIEKISKIKGVSHLKSSSLYKTAPISEIAQGDYINLVCSLQVDCKNPFLFLKELQEIEKCLGKKPSLVRNAPRKIDIDILIFGKQFIKEDSLEIPHPRMLERLFVLEPLFDLVSELDYPDSKGQPKRLFLKKLILEIKKERKQVVLKMAG